MAKSEHHIWVLIRDLKVEFECLSKRLSKEKKDDVAWWALGQLMKLEKRV